MEGSKEGGNWCTRRQRGRRPPRWRAATLSGGPVTGVTEGGAACTTTMSVDGPRERNMMVDVGGVRDFIYGANRRGRRIP